MGVWWGARGDEICSRLHMKDEEVGEKEAEVAEVPSTEVFQTSAGETAGKIDPDLND
jgi:hypothetical protein